MAIDPKLYEKYSGRRPGDAHARLGAALVQSDAQRARNAARPKGHMGGAGSYWKWRAIMGAITSLLILGAIAWGLK